MYFSSHSRGSFPAWRCACCRQSRRLLNLYKQTSRRVLMSVGWLLPPCEISQRRSAAVDRKTIGGVSGYQFGELAPKQLCQSRDEAVGIGLVVIDVGEMRMCVRDN